MTTALRLVRRAIAPLTRTRAFRAVAPLVLPPIERLLARLTDGRVQLSGLLVPSLVPTTTGAKSGERRRTYPMNTPDGRGRAIVAGTTFAQERHPGWTYNLLAHPEAGIAVRGRRLRVRASLIEGDDEREVAWALIESQCRDTVRTNATRVASCDSSGCSRSRDRLSYALTSPAPASTSSATVRRMRALSAIERR